VTIWRACVFAYCALGEIATLDPSKRCAEYDITADNYRGPYRWMRTHIPYTHTATTQPARSPASDCCVPVIRRSARRSSAAAARRRLGSPRRTSPRVNVNAREMLSLSLSSLPLPLSLSVCTPYVQMYKPTYKRVYFISTVFVHLSSARDDAHAPSLLRGALRGPLRYAWVRVPRNIALLHVPRVHQPLRPLVSPICNLAWFYEACRYAFLARSV